MGKASDFELALRVFFQLLKRPLILVFCLGFLVLPYQNCSGYNDPSPFGLNTTDISSISGDVTQPKLNSPLGAFDVTIYDSMVSIGGECSVGTSAKHYIELTVQDDANKYIALKSSVSCPECYRMTNARCEHGRYYATVPIGCSAYRGTTASLYRLSGQLVTYDDKNQEVRAPTAKFDRFFQIAWVQGSCL
ncbi:MAG: hypothetical protein COT73_01820 [Bdellovibrio sp. CG10_big_fil_rev_8_21_14_0_10_47_8]|nr:MAG: hypothetical protein COT73_01820 [Bdellovibrio sp. CG10_big_fil_rev_8_21_14_0_10_47_8]